MTTSAMAFISSLPVRFGGYATRSVISRGEVSGGRYVTATRKGQYARLPSQRRSVSCSATTADGAALEAIQSSNVMVFSTTYCPFCARVKGLFTDLGVKYTVWDVDTMDNGDVIRSWLLEYSGQRTVPNVFIKGQHIGGCDDTFELYESGKLLKMIEE